MVNLWSAWVWPLINHQITCYYLVQLTNTVVSTTTRKQEFSPPPPQPQHNSTNMPRVYDGRKRRGGGTGLGRRSEEGIIFHRRPQENVFWFDDEQVQGTRETKESKPSIKQT